MVLVGVLIGFPAGVLVRDAVFRYRLRHKIRKVEAGYSANGSNARPAFDLKAQPPHGGAVPVVELGEHCEYWLERVSRTELRFELYRPTKLVDLNWEGAGTDEGGKFEE